MRHLRKTGVTDDGKLLFNPGVQFTDANGAASIRCRKDQVLFAQGDMTRDRFAVTPYVVQTFLDDPANVLARRVAHFRRPSARDADLGANA